MTYSLLILALFIWPFGQLLNFQLPNLSLTLYPLDAVTLLIFLSLLFSSKVRQEIAHDQFFKPLTFFFGFVFLSVAANFKQVFYSGSFYPLFYLVRLFIYPSIYFAARLASPKKIVPHVILSVTTFSLIGLLQYLFMPDMRFLKLLGFDDHLYRLIGSFYDPNFSGAIFGAAALAFMWQGYWLASAIQVALLVLTFSRASYLVFLLGLFYLLFSKKKAYLLIYPALFSLILFLVPKPFGEGVNLLRTFSIFSRLGSWSQGIDLVAQKPLFGWGYNTLRMLTGDRFQIDNSYLYIAATTGILGLLSFLDFLKTSLISTRNPYKLSILAILLHSLFNNSLFYIWIYFSFWLILGLSTKAYKES